MNLDIKIIEHIIVTETILFIGLIPIFYLLKFLQKSRYKKHEQKIMALVNLYEKSIKNEDALTSFIKKIKISKYSLSVLLSFIQKLDKNSPLYERCYTDLVLPAARKNSNHKNKRIRLYASYALSIAPSTTDENNILFLLKDKITAIKLYAIKAGICLASAKITQAIINQCAKETTTLQVLAMQLFATANKSFIKQVIDYQNSTKDPNIINLCDKIIILTRQGV